MTFMSDGTGDARPNILLISCDQLRKDMVGCYGNRVIRTPNIDRLGEEGVICDNYYTQSPVCQPSRATMATGRYPSSHGVKSNWYDLPAEEVKLQQVLTDHGYATRAIGKMHFDPSEELHGFEQRVFVEGKLFVEDDEYRLHLDQIGKRRLYEEHLSRFNNDVVSGPERSPLDYEDYIDSFIGKRAVEELTELPSPFFAWVSFVNPHRPYDPPKPYDGIYDPDSVPLPHDWQLMRQEDHYPEHRTSSAGRDFSDLTEEILRQITAYYMGTVTLVDEIIGQILDLLELQGRLDDTVVVFTSDHGEFLGHRGLLGKGNRMLYDDLLRVPFIIRYPRELGKNVIISEMCQATDLMPTLLDYAGAEIPAGVQGVSLRPVLEQRRITNWRGTIFAEALEVKMVRDHDWKLIWYPGKHYGEMYHVADDPLEQNNLFYDSRYGNQRARLVERLADCLALSEDPLPGPSRRSGYGGAGRRRDAELL